MKKLILFLAFLSMPVSGHCNIFDPDTMQMLNSSDSLISISDALERAKIESNRVTNLYRAHENNPLRYTDPTGKVSESIVAQYTSPEVQAVIGRAGVVIGSGAVVFGGYAALTGLGTPAGVCSAGIGAGLIYEGYRNEQRAQRRLGSNIPDLVQ